MKKTASLILAVLLTMVFCVPVFAATSSTGKDDPTFDKNTEYVPPADPKLYISEMISDVYEAGGIKNIQLWLSTSNAHAEDVRMQLVGPEGYVNDFHFYTTTGWFKAGEVSTQKKVTPAIQVSPNVPDGTYQVTVNYKYTRSATEFSATEKINLTVHGRSNTVPKISSAAFAKQEIGIDNKTKLTVRIENPSPFPYEDFTISLANPGADVNKGFSLYENYDPINLGRLDGETTKEVSYSVYVDSTVVTGNYPLTFHLSYRDGTGAVLTSKEVVTVQLKRTAEADGKGSVPRIIVSNYKIDVEEIKAGKEFTLTFNLKNTSPKTTVKNIKVVLGSTTTSGSGTGTGQGGSTSGEVFFPAAGSNSFYISQIAPGGSSEQTIKLMSKQDAEPGVYSVTLKLDYEGDAGQTIPAAEEQIAFSLIQEQRLEVQGMNIPTNGSAGTPLPINFQYINKGKATIYNLSVTVDGDFTLEGGSQYVGNLTPGYNDYFDNVIIPSSEGPLSGAIVLKYEDSAGTEKELRSEFKCEVMAGGDMGGSMGGAVIGGMGEGDMPGMAQMVPQGGGFNWLWVIIPGVVLLLAGGVVTVIILKKRKQRMMVDDEED